MRIFNQDLLIKWLWCYNNELEVLWKSVIVCKYRGLWGDWCTNEVNMAYGMSVWKHIRCGWGDFFGHARFEMGAQRNFLE